MTKSAIFLESVTKYYDLYTRALNNVSLAISEGDWVSIIGPSGSGKTTLLNIMSGLDTPSSGTIRVNETDITGLGQNMLTRFRRENIGLIFQQYHLIPYLTALENVMIAQYFQGTVDKEAACVALENVGLGHRIEHRPSQLSGGEQQRVCIARALINKPNILLADEPTGNLDVKNGEIVMEIIRKLVNEGHTVVIVTHNMDIAKQSRRIIEMVDGKISADSTPTPTASVSARIKHRP
jgi:putative ABC transport system ATP-binding protein